MHPVFDSSSLPMVEEMFARYTADRASVPTEWQAYFAGWLAAGDVHATAGGISASTGAVCEVGGECDKAMRRANFMRGWRKWGHVVARTDPLLPDVEVPYALTPEGFGLEEGDLDEGCRKVRERYSGTVGVEIGAINDPAERAWAIKWWEGDNGASLPPPPLRAALWRGLYEAAALEQFLHRKFVGMKRFSAEGTEAVVPLLNWLVDAMADAGGKHVVLGMAHRGRLNVLCHVLGKPYAELMAAFAGTLVAEGGPTSGDVKYHLGRQTVKNGVDVRLLYNPSHLEAVNPMVLGCARALADACGDTKQVLPVLLHGDSAVAGQGVVAECNNMAPVKAYTVGGALHIVVNNKVGFTANPEDAFGGHYCTDIFRSLGVPIVHVNADDMDACWRAVRFALEYRLEFGRDVVVDVVGYRRWGHNEGDDPTFTQPEVYARIKDHRVAAEIYGDLLVDGGALAAEARTTQQDEVAAALEDAFGVAQQGLTYKTKPAAPRGKAAPATAVGKDTLAKVAAAWQAVPEGFRVHPKVGRVVDERVAMLEGRQPLNWGAAETAAYATLLMDGVGWRMTGQDVERGTFSHRHAVLTDAENGARWDPLAALAGEGVRYAVDNSVLSENAVLGFEYGYALADRATLVMWEAQFGDFANGAQVVIDQFIASAHAKWGQRNHLAVLLPHGYEGQGPEHSSARLERFLQLCAEDNMAVAYPSTPAQVFHLLRRQGLAGQQPLVVMTPKSLLRLPAAVSGVEDLTRGGWQPVMPDTTVAPRGVKTVCLCTGKVYYDLLAARESLGEEGQNVALVRVEELYPWPAEEIAKALAPYKSKNVLWVQEEPRNMGAWAHVREHWGFVQGEMKDEKFLRYVGRPASASPAAGTTEMHRVEQERILAEIFGDRILQGKVA